MVSEACCNSHRTQAVFPDPVIKLNRKKKNEDKNVGIIHKLLYSNPLYAVSIHNESAS